MPDTYLEELKKKINIPALQPSFDEPGYLRELAWVAGASLNDGEIQGCIAATIIYQQLIEQLLSNLIELSEFYMQLKIYPEKIILQQKKEITLGQLINEFNKLTIEFKYKSQLIQLSKKYNKVRIFVAHGISHGNDVNEIYNKTENIQESYEKIFSLWHKSAKWFYQQIDIAVQALKNDGVLNNNG